jgi:sugar lactone lactonase YvrE
VTLPFGNQPTNTTSSSPQVTVLTNTGNVPVTSIAVTVTGTNATAFAAFSTCGTTLAVGANCSISVTFTPSATGANSATLNIADSATGSPQTASLTGTGVATSVVAPAALSFNSASVGIALGSAQTITATFTLNGYGAGFTPTAKLRYGTSFSIGAPNCTGTAGSETCSVAVTFQPQYPGARKDALQLMNGTSVISTLLVGGVGQSPFALIQPGVVTQPILSNANYLYQSTVGEDGTAYVTGDNSNSVYSITKAGVVTLLPITGLSSPHGIAIDGAGTLYIAQNNYGKQIITYTAGGVQGAITVVPPAPYVPCSNSNGGTLEYLYSVAVDQTGNLFALEILCNQIFKLSPSGTYTTTTISPVMTQPSEITVDSADNVFIGGYAINELTAGGVQTQINTIGAGDGIGVDAADTLYATRYTGTSGVAELPATGYATLEAALDLGSSPLGTSVGPDGTVYVGNYTNLDKVDRSQGAVAFGEQFTGSASTPQNVAIYNGGNQPLTVSNFVIAGTGFAMQAATTNNCTIGIVIAPGAFCQIAVTETPPHAGTFSGTITITSNSLNTASTIQTVALSGFAYGVYVTPSPTSLTFPNQIVNTTSAAQTITLTNNGDLYSAGIGVITSTSPAYSVTLGNCSTAINVGASCNLSVTFTPTAAQTYNNVTITVPYSSTGGGAPPPPVTFTVNGTGLPAAVPTLSPNPLAFPGTIVGASTTLPVTLTNPAATALAITGISFTGTNASNFAQTNNCGASLAAGATCTITVTFTPTSIANANASISVADNASGSPHTAALTGSGITFVSNVGTALTAQPVTLFFTTAGTLSSIQVLTQGTAGLDFTSGSGGTCATGTTYTVGQSCTVNVIFTPKFAGVRAGSVLLTDSSGNALATANLPGTGLGPQIVFGTGVQSTIVPFSANYVPTGVAVDGSGNLYFVNSNTTSSTYGVFKLTKSGSTYSAPVAIGSGYNDPIGLAVDGSGNVYVGDYANYRVVKIPWTGSAYGPQTTVPLDAKPFREPKQVFVDSLGNVYFADYGYGTVDEVPWTGSGYGTLITLPFTGLNSPNGVAVDANGDVFCADTFNHRVVELPRTSSGFGAQTTIATVASTISPAFLAVDGSGDIYVAEQSAGNGAVVQIPWTGSAYGAPVNLNVTGLGYGAWGVATDAAGNVVVGGSLAGTLFRLDRADAPALSFATTSVGATSSDSPQTVTVQNIGNVTFAFGVPNTGTNPSYPANFPVNSADTSLCSFGLALAQSATCDVSVNFKPTASGSLTGNVVLTDNQLNVPNATQSIAVSGTGNAAAAPQATLSPNPLAFPSTTVGASAATMPMTLSNPGTAALTITSISVTGPSPSLRAPPRPSPLQSRSPTTPPAHHSPPPSLAPELRLFL